MKFNKWTVGLAAVGVVSLASAARADEQMSMVNTALSQTTLSGYVDTAMQWNPGTDNRSTSDYPGNVPRYAFAQDDGFTLNAIDIALDKPEDSSQWAAGYHIEMMFGADAVGAGFGLYNDYDDTDLAGYSATVRQAFIRLHTPVGGNGIDWQIGVWDSIIGYESNSDPLNPNYTRSYAYTIEPTTFTGILGTYKVNDEISVSAGIANDEYNIYAPFTPGNKFESEKAYLASVSLTAPDSMGFLKGATFSTGVIHNNDTKEDGWGPTTSFYAGATIPTPINSLKVGGSFDYLWQSTLDTTPSQGLDIWDIAGYATVQATDKLSFNFRAEFLDDGNSFGDTAVEVAPGQDVEELTATVQYNLWANVITRGEFRWDHSTPFPDDFGISNTGESFRRNDFLFALNVIYQF